MTRIQIKIKGKVQGVFFRHTARQQALIMQITGWIKNLPDGSVLCEASGDETSIKQFIAWCKKGPDNARVTETNIEYLDNEKPSAAPIGFQILN